MEIADLIMVSLVLSKYSTGAGALCVVRRGVCLLFVTVFGACGALLSSFSRLFVVQPFL